MPKCKGCGADILWIEMITGKMMPVDEKPESRIVVYPEGIGKVTATYMPHWATCDKASKFRKEKSDA